MSDAKQTDDATFEDRINTAPGPDIYACYDDSKGLKALLEISAGQHVPRLPALWLNVTRNSKSP